NTWINSTAETEREAEEGRNEGKLARRKVKTLHEFLFRRACEDTLHLVVCRSYLAPVRHCYTRHEYSRTKSDVIPASSESIPKSILRLQWKQGCLTF
ncbi:hypothetical protein IRJ41_025115, partial [Triplophysa rosa]